MRRRQAGDVVTYVVNRNINFTNVCIKHCTFCAFSRDHREEEGYFLPMDEVVRRAIEAWEMGATEVCIQAGLPPKLDGSYYIDLCRAIKAAVPEMHLHAFSPEEILYGSTRSGMPIPEYLADSRRAGLGTLPGTSAEILDQEIRDVIARGRITVDQWVEVITSAHALGIRTTSTIMYGHVERPDHWIRHMNLLRSIQKDTGGFTEFVPLSLIHQEAPMYRRGDWCRACVRGATGIEVVKMHAIARLFLGPTFRNIQSSWVKEGPKLAQCLLTTGANDVGGTLINESISTSAGAGYGQLVPPAELRRLIRDAGRVPAQRNTEYELMQDLRRRRGRRRSRRWTTSRTPRRASAPTESSRRRASSGSLHSRRRRAMTDRSNWAPLADAARDRSTSAVRALRPTLEKGRRRGGHVVAISREQPG